MEPESKINLITLYTKLLSDLENPWVLLHWPSMAENDNSKASCSVKQPHAEAEIVH